MSEPATPIQADKVYAVEIKCPNCRMIQEHTYTTATYSPVYGQCKLCNTLYRWSKTRTVAIVPADRQHQLTITVAFKAMDENKEAIIKKG